MKLRSDRVWFRRASPFCVVFALVLGGCKGAPIKPYVFPDEVMVRTDRLRIIQDIRPEIEKRSSSVVFAKCEQTYGDDSIDPPAVYVIESELEEALGDALSDGAVELSLFKLDKCARMESGGPGHSTVGGWGVYEGLVKTEFYGVRYDDVLRCTFGGTYMGKGFYEVIDGKYTEDTLEASIGKVLNTCIAALVDKIQWRTNLNK